VLLTPIKPAAVFDELKPQQVRPDLGPDAGPGAPYPFDGSTTGSCSDGQQRTALTVMQEVPNIGQVQTAPKTRVNPTHEQGVGRAPGWKNGWMRKNIPYNLAFGRNCTKRLGQTRVEGPINSGVHGPGKGAWQSPMHATSHRGTIDPPQTVYLTAAIPPTPSWGEPL
jgi:hypothetical protein